MTKKRCKLAADCICFLAACFNFSVQFLPLSVRVVPRYLNLVDFFWCSADCYPFCLVDADSHTVGLTAGLYGFVVAPCHCLL